MLNNRIERVKVGTLVKAIGVSVLDAYDVDEVKRDFHSVIDLLDVDIFESTTLRLVVDLIGKGLAEENEVCFISGITGGVHVNGKNHRILGERVFHGMNDIEVLVGGETVI